MAHIFRNSYPLKVVNSIVELVPIFMIDLVFAILPRNKMFSDNTVEQGANLNPIMPKCHLCIIGAAAVLSANKFPLSAKLTADDIAIRVDKVVGEVFDLFFHHTIFHVLPVGTVTDTPELIVTGPNVPAFFPTGIV